MATEKDDWLTIWCILSGFIYVKFVHDKVKKKEKKHIFLRKCNMKTIYYLKRSLPD